MILAELPDLLHRHTRFVETTQLTSWKTYLRVFLARGGTVEAYPPSANVTSLTVCLAIEPNGHHSIICSGDQLHLDSLFSCWGLAFPQTSADARELNHCCALIAERCKQRNIYGHLDIDFVTFFDAQNNRDQLWLTDLSIGYSEHVSLYRVTSYVTMGRFHSPTHSFAVPLQQAKQRLRNWQNGHSATTVSDTNGYAVWSSRLWHSNLSQMHYSQFLPLCRTHGVGFDVRQKQGTILTLFESHKHEHFGMITVGDTAHSALSSFLTHLTALSQMFATVNSNDQRTNLLVIGVVHRSMSMSIRFLVTSSSRSMVSGRSWL